MTTLDLPTVNANRQVYMLFMTLFCNLYTCIIINIMTIALIIAGMSSDDGSYDKLPALKQSTMWLGAQDGR